MRDKPLLIGYWREKEWCYDSLQYLPFPEGLPIKKDLGCHPLPQWLVREWPGGDKEKIIRYLNSGKVYYMFDGWSDCRFCNECVGGKELYDGEFVCPEELNHYVAEHDVVLPLTFIKHVRERNYNIPRPVKGFDFDSMKKNQDFSFWRDWTNLQIMGMLNL